MSNSDSIYDLVYRSTRLTATQKVLIRTFMDATAQAAHNMATGENGGISYNQVVGNDKNAHIDFWGIFYNQMITAAAIGLNMEENAFGVTFAEPDEGKATND
jgi:hypothetical protein